MELIILYLPLFMVIHSFHSLPINPGFPVVDINQSNLQTASFQRAFKSATKLVQKNCRNIMSPSMSGLVLV